jgi:hypothetical protein
MAISNDLYDFFNRRDAEGAESGLERSSFSFRIAIYMEYIYRRIDRYMLITTIYTPTKNMIKAIDS